MSICWQPSASCRTPRRAFPLCGFSRDLDVRHKTAFVLAHKIREALAAESTNMKLEGDIEINGAYFGGHVRPPNFAKDRVDRRLAENQTGKRRVMIPLVLAKAGH